jgi:hypothetical protein
MQSNDELLVPIKPGLKDQLNAVAGADALGEKLAAEIRHLFRVMPFGNRRRHPHRPQFHKSPILGKGHNAKDRRDKLAPPLRRAHGLATHVAPAPSVVESAQKRAKLYMHSAARRRLEVAEAEASKLAA